MPPVVQYVNGNVTGFVIVGANNVTFAGSLEYIGITKRIGKVNSYHFIVVMSGNNEVVTAESWEFFSKDSVDSYEINSLQPNTCNMQSLSKAGDDFPVCGPWVHDNNNNWKQDCNVTVNGGTTSASFTVSLDASNQLISFQELSTLAGSETTFVQITVTSSINKAPPASDFNVPDYCNQPPAPPAAFLRPSKFISRFFQARKFF